MRFEQETGIRESDWAGRYWTTWGEAVREAGFERQSLTEGYGDEVLLAHLAALVRRLGKFPPATRFGSHAKRMLDFRATTRSPASGGNATSSSGCSITARAQAVRMWRLLRCVGRCLPVCLWPRQRKSAWGTGEGLRLPDVLGPSLQMGRTNSLGRREYESSIQLPERLELVHAMETDDTAGIERYWHDRFADRRANGEWFALTKADVLAFKRRKKFRKWRELSSEPPCVAPGS